MKAIVVHEFGAPDVMKLEDVADPVPGSGQVLIRVGAVGVNPVETYIRAGTYARKPNLPYTPGSDVGGTIEKIGAGVTAFKPGDRVYTQGAAGGYAELLVCDDAQAHPLPARVSFAQGAALGVPYSTAWRALFLRAQARAGETLLVHGASGGVGIAAVELGRAHGLRVIDISNPHTPREVGHALTVPQGVARTYPVFKDGLIYWVDNDTGLHVARYTGPRADELPGPGTGTYEGNATSPHR